MTPLGEGVTTETGAVIGSVIELVNAHITPCIGDIDPSIEAREWTGRVIGIAAWRPDRSITFIRKGTAWMTLGVQSPILTSPEQTFFAESQNELVQLVKMGDSLFGESNRQSSFNLTEINCKLSLVPNIVPGSLRSMNVMTDRTYIAECSVNAYQILGYEYLRHHDPKYPCSASLIRTANCYIKALRVAQAIHGNRDSMTVDARSALRKFYDDEIRWLYHLRTFSFLEPENVCSILAAQELVFSMYIEALKALNDPEVETKVKYRQVVRERQAEIYNRQREQLSAVAQPTELSCFKLALVTGRLAQLRHRMGSVALAEELEAEESTISEQQLSPAYRQELERRLSVPVNL